MKGLTVESIMTSNVQAVTQTMTVREAILLLVEKKISGAPVVDKLEKVVSVVSEGDLLKLAASHGLDKPIAMCVDKLVKVEKLVTAKKTEPFTEVYKRFLSHPVHRILVTDGNGKLQGIVTRSNVLKVLIEGNSAAAAGSTAS